MLAEPTLSPRLVDVAKKAGVSPAAVSGNNRGQVNRWRMRIDARRLKHWAMFIADHHVPASKTIAVFITDIQPGLS
jgi:hypothetical protein